MPDNEDLKKTFTGEDNADELAKDFSGVEPVHGLPPPFEPGTKAFFDKKARDERQPWNHVTLQVKKLPHYEGLPNLRQATEGSVGIDLYAANNGTLLLNSIGATVVVPTGISIAIPHGFEAQIRPRSGLAVKEGLTVLNSPGTIDSDYRGEIKVLLTKLTTGKFKVERGMRIAQMVICPVVFPTVDYVDELDGTERGAGGFGSSGRF